MPKTLSETLNAVEVKVATRLATLRHDQGFTLKQLAQRSSLSESYLSRIENHKAAINIANLDIVARVLGVPISAFFEDTLSERPISVCRSGKGKTVRLREAKGLVAKMLASDKKGKLMEPFIVDLTSAEVKQEQKRHQGEEFVYVLAGECVFHYGKEKIRLQKGDSAYYDPRIPHLSMADPVKGCTVIAVVASRNYLFHGDINRLLVDE
jgi:mannose-6-phosphate isomerase-like protein (cupin superfamily)